MTIKEQLDQNGYDTTNLFMPEEYDNAFLGLAITDWHYKHAKYELVDLKTGQVWHAAYNLKQFMTELMNDNPKWFK